jgi:YD repeat-containing protein
MIILHFRTLIAISAVILITSSAFSQTTTQYDRATPPQHTAGVSAIGSYVSADLGNVNLSNGALNLKIPIGTIGGRGLSMPITLNYSSKVWSASTDTAVNQLGVETPVAYADYDRGSDWIGWWDFIGAGWTVGGVPMLTPRRVQIQKITGGPCSGGYTHLLTKLTLKLPDGGEVEFRDDVSDGAPLPASGCGASAASRGTRWHATDGSGMIFINDVDNGVAAFPVWNLSGVVVTREGTRYRFSAGGQCTSITDRNGNKIKIEYFTPAEVRYTDPLGRITTIKQNVADPDNPSVTLPILVTFPGYQGTPRYFKIKRGIMNANYRGDINPSLPVITGDWDPLSRGYDWPAGTTKLFVKSYGMYAYQIDDLNVLTEVVLPDARSLRFRYNQFGEVAEVMLPTGGKIQYDYSYESQLPSGTSPVWQTGTNGTGGGILTDVRQVDRAVFERRTYPDGVNLEGKWIYDYGPQSVNGINYECTQVQARSNTNALLMDQRHFFLGALQYTEAPNGAGNHDGTHYAKWSTGVEWRTETRDASGNVLSASEQDWTQRAPVS